MNTSRRNEWIAEMARDLFISWASNKNSYLSAEAAVYESKKMVDALEEKGLSPWGHVHANADKGGISS